LSASYLKGLRVEFRLAEFSTHLEGTVTAVESCGGRCWIRPDGTRQQFLIAARNVLRQIDHEITERHPGLDIDAEIAKVQMQRATKQAMKSRWPVQETA
jgi:hypothetical protein